MFLDLPGLWNTVKNLVFPWKPSPFDQTKPALFPPSVTSSFPSPAGPENFLPIKQGLKASCTPEASATARSLQHTTCQKQASTQAHKGCKTSCAEWGKKKKVKKKNARELCQTLSAYLHRCQTLCNLLQGASESHPAAAPGSGDVPPAQSLGEGLGPSPCS